MSAVSDILITPPSEQNPSRDFSDEEQSISSLSQQHASLCNDLTRLNMTSENDVLDSERIVNIVQEYFEFRVKEAQLKALQQAMKSDLIVIAKTGFGKSLLYQVPPLLFSPMKTVLIIMPLLALEDDQCQTLTTIKNCRPIVLNGDNNNTKTLAKIRQGDYTHVFTSPEIAISKRFHDDVLRRESYFSRLCMLAIDELHLVDEWRDFRSEYATLGVLRTRLPVGIPILGVSATLDAETLDNVRRQCGFTRNTSVIKTPLDRPEIYLQFSQMKYPLEGTKDLQHILPRQVEKPQDIPKTVVYVDKVGLVNVICENMRQWIERLDYPKEAWRWVSPLSAPMAATDKQRIQNQFKRMSTDCDEPRILICTEAYGLGVHNADIMRVYQLLLPSSTSKVVQRLGRANRIGQGQAHFVLLYPPWCVGPRSGRQVTERVEEADGEASKGNDRGGDSATEDDNATADDNDRETNDKQAKPRKNALDADRRRDMPRGLWDLINVGVEGGCHREFCLKFFDDVEVDGERPTKFERSKPNPCCSGCHPEKALSTEAHESLNTKNPRNPRKRPWFRDQLKTWRRSKAREVFRECQLQRISTLIMPDEILKCLSAWGERVSNEITLRELTGNTWSGLKEYGPEIMEILSRGQKMSDNDEEVIEARLKEKEDKQSKKSVKAAAEAPEVMEFERRRTAWLIQHGHRRVAKAKVARTDDRPQTANNEHATEGGTMSSPRRQKTVVPAEGLGPRTPRKPRAALQEVSTNVQRELPPTSGGRKRTRPAYLDNCEITPVAKAARRGFGRRELFREE